MLLIIFTRGENDLNNLVSRKNEGVLGDIEVIGAVGTIENFDEGRNLGCKIANIVNIPLGLTSSLRHLQLHVLIHRIQKKYKPQQG